MLVLMVQLHFELQISRFQVLFDPRVETFIEFTTEMILPVASFTCRLQ